MTKETSIHISRFFLLSLALAALLCTSCATHQVNVVIDSGHDLSPPLKRGAVGTCGKSEVEYNDQITSQLIPLFASDKKYNVVLTRTPGKDINLSRLRDWDHQNYLYTPAAVHRYETEPNSRSLLARAVLANRFAHNNVARPPESRRPYCDVFISIHHDSTAPHRLTCDPNLCVGRKNEYPGVVHQRQEALIASKPDDPKATAGLHPCGRTEEAIQKGGGSRLTEDFYKAGFRTGYTILVYGEQDPDSRTTQRRDASLALAKAVSESFQQGAKTSTQGAVAVIGGEERPVANHHTKEEEGHDFKSMGPEFDALGILHRDVAVLRETRCPAILIEVGNISDPEDEAKILKPEFQADLVRRIKAGVDAYFEQIHKD